MSKTQKPIDIVGKYYFNGKSISEFPGSTAFVPAVAGLLIAGEVINDICRA